MSSKYIFQRINKQRKIVSYGFPHNPDINIIIFMLHKPPPQRKRNLRAYVQISEAQAIAYYDGMYMPEGRSVTYRETVAAVAVLGGYVDGECEGENKCEYDLTPQQPINIC